MPRPSIKRPPKIGPPDEEPKFTTRPPRRLRARKLKSGRKPPNRIRQRVLKGLRRRKRKESL